MRFPREDGEQNALGGPGRVCVVARTQRRLQLERRRVERLGGRLPENTAVSVNFSFLIH